MSAGGFGAGTGPCGDDPLADVPAARTVTLPAAIQFDGRTGDYLTDANGRYLASHPVDQRVALKMIVRSGTIGSLPTLGLSLASLNRLPSATRAFLASQLVRNDLADDVKAGDIEIINVRTDTSSPNATLVAVDYVNLRLKPAPATQTATTTVR